MAAYPTRKQIAGLCVLGAIQLMTSYETWMAVMIVVVLLQGMVNEVRLAELQSKLVRRDG